MSVHQISDAATVPDAADITTVVSRFLLPLIFVGLPFVLTHAAFNPVPLDLSGCDFNSPHGICEARLPPELRNLPAPDRVASHCSGPTPPPLCGAATLEGMQWQHALKTRTRLSPDPEMVATVRRTRQVYGEHWANTRTPSWPWWVVAMLSMAWASVPFSLWKIIRSGSDYWRPVSIELAHGVVTVNRRRIALDSLAPRPAPLMPQLGLHPSYTLPVHFEDTIQDGIRRARLGEDRSTAREQLGALKNHDV